MIDLAESDSQLPDVFAEVVTAARAMRPGSRAALFLHDRVGAALYLGTNAGVAEPYMAAVEGFKVAPEQPSCGRVAFITAEVIVPDVTADERWAPYLHVALDNDIRAVWSFPILEGKTVLGTLAVYHSEPQLPTDAESEALRYLATLASAVIIRAQAGKQPAAGSAAESRKADFGPAGRRTGEGVDGLRALVAASRTQRANERSN